MAVKSFSLSMFARNYFPHHAGKDNPADMPSRGISPQKLKTSPVWRHGPDWLPKFSPAQLADMPEDCITEIQSRLVGRNRE